MRASSFLALALTLAVSVPRAQALPADEPVTPSTDSQSGYNGDSGDNSGSSSDSEPLVYKRPRWPIAINFRYGLPLTAQDDYVQRRWEHQIWSSFIFALGGYWESRRILFGDFWAFAGPDFLWAHNIEQLTGVSGTTTLTSDTYGFQFTAGISWQPRLLDRRGGIQLAVGVPIWEQKAADLDSPGFSHDLGRDNLYIDEVMDYRVNFFYDFDNHWKPTFGYEYRVSSNITLGLTYAF